MKRTIYFVIGAIGSAGFLWSIVVIALGGYIKIDSRIASIVESIPNKEDANYLRVECSCAGF